MMLRNELIEHLDSLLRPQDFKDYCPNGLQVEGNSRIEKIVCAVTASERAIDYAIEQQAQALLVHHGYFWRGEDPTITHIQKNRIAKLLNNNINLIAYHLPLDAHAELGNNVQLAKQLEISISSSLATPPNPDLILVGELDTECSGKSLGQHISKTLGREALHISGNNNTIKKVAWCTGAAQDFLPTAAIAGVDAFITGEASERTYHQAQEYGIHFYAAGHHATERYGIQCLGEKLASEYEFEYQFFDEENPI